MSLYDRINYYAKGVIALAGAVVTFGTVLVGVTSDGHVDGGELSTLGVAGVALVTTVVAVIKKRNIKPPEAANDLGTR